MAEWNNTDNTRHIKNIIENIVVVLLNYLILPKNINILFINWTHFRAKMEVMR